MIEQYNQYHFETKFFDNPKACGGLWIYQLGEMLCRPTTVVHPHDQICYELTYVISGSGTVTTNGTETAVSPGDCSINFPGDIHGIISNPQDPLRYAFCAFMDNGSDTVFWSKIINELRQLFPTNERVVRLKDKSDIFFELFNEINSNDFMAPELIASIISQFLIVLIRSKRKENEAHYSPQIKSETILVYQIHQYLRQHIHEIRKLADLESIFNYNYRYISKCFKKITGESLGNYYLKCRMNVSCKMLEEGFSVTQISEFLRYSSVHVFTRSFKNYFGITPSEYRRNKKNTPETPDGENEKI